MRRYVLDRWRDDLLPVNAFLVEHREGLCLFDTGQSASAARPGHFPWWQPFFRLARFELTVEAEVAPLLARQGLSPRDIRWVVLSHLHTDHVGGLAPFAGSDVFVTREEWERGGGVRGRIRGYLPQYWPDQIVPRLVDFDGPAVGPFSGSCDVAGDGRLLIVPTPGHTPGHASLLVRGEKRSWLLAGDLVHMPDELLAAAPAIHRFCVDEGTIVLTAHDPRAAALVET